MVLVTYGLNQVLIRNHVNFAQKLMEKITPENEHLPLK